MKEYILRNFEPQITLRHFEEICAIPHGSGNESALADHIFAFAKAHGCFAVKDEANNVFVRVPASDGMEDRPAVLLQGHLDMVCVHRPELDIDMASTPVKLVLDGNILRADGTSLGADNAVGMCHMLALMEDRTVVHPPLELLFTSEEEVGCVGITKFDMSLITARRMISMDCGSMDTVNLGSAGISKFRIDRGFAESALGGSIIKVTIDGLLGGHTSGSLGNERGSAVDFMGRILGALCDEFDTRLSSVNMPGAFSGSMPCYIDFTFGTAEDKAGRAVEIISKLYEDFRDEVLENEPDFTLSIENAKADKAMSAEDTRTIADLILISQYGAQHRSQKILSRIRCSSLIPIVEYADGKFTAHFSVRANTDAYMDCTVQKMQAACRVLGFEMKRLSRTYGWLEKKDSKLCSIVKTAYTAINGGEMRETVTHGGLEAGFISKYYPDMDIVGFAPDSRGAHTVDERLYVESMKPFWDFLRAVLIGCCEG